MNGIDWLVLSVTLIGIILYGLLKSKSSRNLEGYFLSNRSMPWWIVLLSIMGTQASAVTFLSAPGQAFADGMRFVQYYFGLPLAMVVICITFVPLFNRLKVFTAYEFLEKRFDTKTRLLTSFLFLLQRGLSTGISIYAPALILSSLFGWEIFYTNIVMGGLLIIYTVSGGARAVAYTQQIQFLIIFAAMFLAGYMVVHLLPSGIGFVDALHIGGKLGKFNIITTGVEDGKFNWNDKYNIWSGIIGGGFLALSYFGTDQSQVGRYLTAQNNTESRLGLLLNGMVKIPMQFFILLIGVLIFSFYQFNGGPISFNSGLVNDVRNSAYADSLAQLEARYKSISSQKETTAVAFAQAVKLGQQTEERQLATQIASLNKASTEVREAFKEIGKKASSRDTNDTNYVFLSFVKEHLPAGLRGLLVAIIFLAAWGSIAAALNSLAASTVCDFHQHFKKGQTPEQEFLVSRWYTLAWGVFCVLVAEFANQLGQSLIEAVNVLGSLFYGVILGIFLLAFYCKRVGGRAAFWSAVIVELFIVVLFFNEQVSFFSFLPDVSFLWLNAIGALGVVLLGLLLQGVQGKFVEKSTTVV